MGVLSEDVDAALGASFAEVRHVGPHPVSPGFAPDSAALMGAIEGFLHEPSMPVGEIMALGRRTVKTLVFG